MGSETIIMVICSTIITLMYIFAVAFYHIIPIAKMNKRANGKVIFPHKNKFIIIMVIGFLFCILLIVCSFEKIRIYQLITLFMYPSLFMQGTVIARSKNELFINGRIIQIAEVESLNYTDDIYLNIKEINKKPFKIYANKGTKRFLNDLVENVQRTHQQAGIELKK